MPLREESKYYQDVAFMRTNKMEFKPNLVETRQNWVLLNFMWNSYL